MQINRRQLRSFFLVTSLLSILNIAVLLTIPHEPGNAFLFGYSAPRLGLLVFSFLLCAFFVTITINLWRQTPTGERIINLVQNFFQDAVRVRALHGAVLLGLAIGTFFLVELAFTDNRYLFGILLRLSPLIGLITIACAHLNTIITKTTKHQDLWGNFPIQLYLIALVWIILNLIWFLGTIQPLGEVLIFKRVVILCLSGYFFTLLTLDYFLTSDRTSRWITACSLILITSMALWITNRFNELSEYEIVSWILLPTFIVEFIFLVVTLFRDKRKQNIPIFNTLINIKEITIFFGIFATILATLALFLQMPVANRLRESYSTISDLLALDREMNVPATFSAVILLIAAGLLFYLFATRRAKRAAFTWHWGFLGAGFVFLSFDEMFSFHESLIGPMRNYVKIGGIFSYEWIIIAIPVVLVLGVTYARFFFHLPVKLRILIFVAAVLFLGGSIGGEMLSGWYASRFGEGDSNYILLTIFEETLEMTGVIVFIHTLLLMIYLDPSTKLADRYERTPTSAYERETN